MRLIILVVLIYLCYRVVKSWMMQNKSPQKTVFGKAAEEIEDDMVKDPFCEVYFSRRDGVHLKDNGEDLYFCSTECRDKYIASRSKK